ncbi:3-dehydrosphinganine reductase [Gurleya vavrai]
MKKLKINLYIYFVTTMKTPGYDRENESKPEFTKSIEGKGGLTPERAAEILLDGMQHSSIISSDYTTYIFRLKSECRNIFEILISPFATILYFIINQYVKFRF